MASEPGTQSRVMFQTKEEEPAQRKLGKLTVKYNRKDLQRRLDIEEWIDGQLHLLYDCEEEEIPELEIDIDELLELTDAEQRSRLHELLQECGKPKEVRSPAMAECDADWELCKENIQPLRQGRSVSALHQALCQQQEGNHTALNQQKQAFESELRMYDGDDPLDVWVRYIKWTKQTYPQGGKESNLSVLLERAVTRFTSDKKYLDDGRYVELWIEFGEGCSDPMDVYRYMHAQGIGCRQAALYIAWSEEYEKRGNIKMADGVFQDGIKCGAEPAEKLRVFHRALQARACRQMMSSMTDQQRDDEDDEDEGPAEPQRASLVELKAKGKKKAVVPINRASASVGYARGLQFKQPLGPKQNSRLVVFDESKAPEAETREPKLEMWTAPPAARAKENEQKAEKWTDVKLPLKSRSGLGVAVPAPKASFQPFVEEDEQPPAVTPCKINPAVNPVLSARRPCRPEQTPLKTLQERMQLHTEEDVRSREQSMYCRELLYGGASEFCFEELRAERYRHKHPHLAV
ncbi:mitotic checkpoint serine/threonine-protein kinase BUB1 beta [Puntigrus tetrazona]|uniref:mitotic checkpoint serine/threonine-protein kinase BUB1 beta n=1 Tax=Puntigrus tetrazona TaxID=1606681 RepID=UPI001C88F78B|nr:mitotic checkpoint serine/threonine-protein kinase BUB1 beta [Puntigrus tetrazona]